MRRQPGFALTIVVTLALGITVNMTAFTIVNGAALRPLPFQDSDQLVQLNVRNVANARSQDSELSYLEYQDWRGRVATVLPAILVGTGGGNFLAIAGVAIVLVVAGLAASAVPARRAMRLDPTTALQAE